MTAFVVAQRFGTQQSVASQIQQRMFDKMFEEEGPLGKGITVGKVQIALIAEDRGENSIFALLEDNARWVADDDEPGSLADLAHEVCMSLLRKKDSWTAACSESKWFKADDYGKAEAQFNDWANTEAAKFEKVKKELLEINDSTAFSSVQNILTIIIFLALLHRNMFPMAKVKKEDLRLWWSV